MLAFAVQNLLAAMAVFGALIELLQMIPSLHRDVELADFAADCGRSRECWFSAGESAGWAPG